ncbi:hypothetical protein [Eisenibacter elegans]|jgi:hypothetical protein|uniref:hypothetical protein n=1 Tax=Eisenibacter elegans TaxID=997 RepID=UPI00047DAC90|nr:hypothetical protein [Eisenibacter elegans]
MFRLTFCLLLLIHCFSATVIAQERSTLPSPAGYAYYSSDCASGGYDYYFFDDGRVVAVWAVAQQVQLTGGIALGTWQRRRDGVVEMHYTLAKGLAPAEGAKVIMVANEAIYDRYQAVEYKPEVLMLETKVLLHDGDTEDCSRIDKHKLSYNAQQFFQKSLQVQGIKRQYEELSYSLIDRNTLKKANKAKLKAMHAELWQLYGGVDRADIILMNDNERANYALLSRALGY